MTVAMQTNLMLVEDERVVALDLKLQLQSFGYRVGAMVASGEQALERIDEVAPDLVLMDIHLEGALDGVDTARAIMTRHSIPVIYLTAFAEDDTLSRALDTRPFGYLVKPWDVRELHATIQMALARREIERTVGEDRRRSLAQGDVTPSSVVFHAAAEALVVTDPVRRIGMVNAAFTRITGYREDEALGLDVDLLLRVSRRTADEHDRFYTELAASNEGYWQGEVDCRRRNGVPFPAWQSLSVVRNADGAVDGFVVALSDVTEIHAVERELEHLAHHDPLTGLPNRLTFDDRFEQAIELARREQHCCMLLYLDLDNFKFINETLGHLRGDELLCRVADRLHDCLLASDTIARLGGDEFIVLTGISSPQYGVDLAQRMLDALSTPVTLGDEAVTPSASIGIATFPEDGQDRHDLMRAADIAMYEAKAEGGGGYCLYSLSTARHRSRQYVLEKAVAPPDDLFDHPAVRGERPRPPNGGRRRQRRGKAG